MLVEDNFHKQINKVFKGDFGIYKVCPNTQIIKSQTVDGHTKIAIKLHETDIVSFYPNLELFFLNNGGWFTKITKERINWFFDWLSRNMNIKFDLWQNNRIWYVAHDLKTYIFFEGMILSIANESPGPGFLLQFINFNALRHTKAEIFKKLIIDQYVEGFIQALAENKIKEDAGDCLSCQFEIQKEKLLGYNNQSDQHLYMHLQEKYYMMSLLFNAFRVSGRENWFRWHMSMYGKIDVSDKHIRAMVSHSLKDFFIRRIEPMVLWNMFSRSYRDKIIGDKFKPYLNNAVHYAIVSDKVSIDALI